MKWTLTRLYLDAILVSVLLFQLFTGVLSLLITDCGQVFQIWAIAMAAYWTGAIVIMARRPATPTRVDLFLIRWAFPFIFILAIPLTTLIWKARGLME